MRTNKAMLNICIKNPLYLRRYGFETTEKIIKGRICVIPSSKIPSVCCVYFLFSKDECLYVGRTHNLKDRLMQHKRRILFDNYSFIKCKMGDGVGSLFIECLYQYILQPKFNNSGDLRRLYQHRSKLIGLIEIK